jgi:hypothetical protein
MYVIYGGYIVLSIVAFALMSLLFPREMAGGTGLARAVNAYIAAFWGIRTLLQGVMDVRPYLSNALERVGYHALTLLFIALTLIYGWAALAAPGAG